MKHVFYISAAIIILLVSGCGKSTQAQDTSMLVSTSESVPEQSAPVPVQEATTTVSEPSLRPTAEYTIRNGDTLWSIAKRQLGSGRRYHEILELNPAITDVESVQIGTRIKLPAM